MLPAHRARRHLATAVAAVAVAGLLALTGAGVAHAHDQLVATDPADGEVLDQAPEVLALTFSADLLDISATVLVTGPQGVVPTTVEVDGSVVRAILPDALGVGGYSVAWRVVSGDGHPIQGAYAFSISATDGPSTTRSSPPSPTDDLLNTPSAITAPVPTGPIAPAPPPAVSGAAWWAGGALLAGSLAGLVARRRSRRRTS